MTFYKSFKADEFVNRKPEIELIQNAVQKGRSGVYIFEGDRGAGKTYLLFELFKQLLEFPNVMPFLISLYDYEAKDLSAQRNIWLKDHALSLTDFPALMQQIADYYQISPQSEYLARGLAHLDSNKLPVLLVDSVYECRPEIQIQLEKEFLAPLLSSNRALIILSGRGRAPEWEHPALNSAQSILLKPFVDTHVHEQLQAMHSEHTDQYIEIHQISGGYPLTVHLLGQAEKSLAEELDPAIDTLLSETFAEDFDDDEYRIIREQMERLVLIPIAFRKIEVSGYILDQIELSKEGSVVKIWDLFLSAHIMQYHYKNGGYQINESLRKPILAYLKMAEQKKLLENYQSELKNNIAQLIKTYPGTEARYEKFVHN